MFDNIKANTKNCLYNISVFDDLPIIGKWISNVSDLIFSLWIFIIFGLFAFVLFYFTAHLECALRLPDGKGLLEDYIFLTYFIFIPLDFIIAKIYFPRISFTLHTLKNVIITEEESNESADIENLDNIKPIPINQFNNYLKECESRILGKRNMKLCKLLFFIAGIAWVVMMANTHWNAICYYITDIWSSKSFRISFITRTFYEFIVIGIIFPYILFKFIMILISIRYICTKLTEDEAIRLRPLNPDRAGGLGEIGKYSLRMILILVPPLLLIMTYVVFENLNIVFRCGLILYIPLLIFAFFFPLSGAHKAMKKFKAKELKRLSCEFNRIYDAFTKGFNTEKISELSTRLKIIRCLDQLYNKAEKMPIWPFDTRTVAKFTGILFAIIASFWINWIFNWLIDRQKI